MDSLTVRKGESNTQILKLVLESEILEKNKIYFVDLNNYFIAT